MNNPYVKALSNFDHSIIVYTAILYTLTNDSRVFYLLCGLFLNDIMYFLVNLSSSTGNVASSLTVQNTAFVFSYFFTRQIMTGKTNGMFILVGLGLLCLQMVTSNFSSGLVGMMIGFILGPMYYYIMSAMIPADSDSDIMIYGAPWADYSKCQEVRYDDVPRVNKPGNEKNKPSK